MFHELLHNPNSIEPASLQAAARKQFPDVVLKSHLESFRRGQQPLRSGKYVLIGVAVYSPQDLQLLDAVDAAYPDWRDTATVAVFDLMECKDPRDVLERYVPTPPYPVIRRVLQSPIVGIWDGPVLVALESGLYDTQKLLRNERFLK
jgi:hypothetical protein